MTKPRIFISHAGADPDWVRAFAKSLKALGALVWLDDWEVQAGEPLGDAIEQALRDSEVIAFILTAETAQRPNFLFELGAAVGMGKRVVPVVPKDFEAARLPHPLRIRKFLLRGSPEETAKRLLAETATEEFAVGK